MFNLSGSEIVVILLLALVVLGPDKLPDAMRKAGRTYAEFRKLSSTFQNEMRQAMDEPVRELRDTADLVRKSATFDGSSASPPNKRTPAAPAAGPDPAPEPSAADAGADPTVEAPTVTPPVTAPLEGDGPS